jgi:hypothetical protein
MIEGISLGWNCSAAQEAIKMGLRNTKNNGYNTCPFDMMITNYIGLCKCIEDDFKYFCDPKYLKLRPAPNMMKYIPNQKEGEMWVYNTYYNFVFNHESPYHGNLYLNERWSSPYHFIDNDFEKFIERYTNRIDNFRNYLNSCEFINFILVRYNSVPIELSNILKTKYPDLNFKIHSICEYTQNNIGHLYDVSKNGGINYEIHYLNYMNITEETEPNEFIRFKSDSNVQLGDVNKNIIMV